MDKLVDGGSHFEEIRTKLWYCRYIVLLTVLILASCANGGQSNVGHVVEFGQSVPASGGMVKSFVEVETEAGETITVWLPNDQAVWDDMRKAAIGGSADTCVAFDEDGETWRYAGRADCAQEEGAVGIDGASLPSYVEAERDSAVGSPVPSLAGFDFFGNSVKIANDDGTAKLILFLAPWDPHSQSVMSDVQAWVDAGRPTDVAVYSVVTAIDPKRPNHPPDEWLQRQGWAVPVLADTTDAAAHAYGLTALPFWVFVTADGTVAARAAGQLDNSEWLSLLTAASRG